MRRSGTTAMATPPRARAGAIRSSQAASPGARRPGGTTMSTDNRRDLRGLIFGGARRRVGVIGLDDLLHQLVTDDVLVVEMDDADAVYLADDFERLDQPRQL